MLDAVEESRRGKGEENGGKDVSDGTSERAEEKRWRSDMIETENDGGLKVREFGGQMKEKTRRRIKTNETTTRRKCQSVTQGTFT